MALHTREKLFLSESNNLLNLKFFVSVKNGESD